MATVVFGAIGASLGGNLLGGVFGTALGGMFGRFIGATVGRKVDEFLFGGSNEPPTPSPIESFRVMSTADGTPVNEIYGRARLAGHLIWMGKAFSKEVDGGHKYYASFAVGLCEGKVHRFGRVWCNNAEIRLKAGSYRFYSGHQAQKPDPLIAKDCEDGCAPAYRGFSYIVFEELELGEFGNQIPHFQFEVFRHAVDSSDETKDYVRAVAMIPGSGDYVYASSAVEMDQGYGKKKHANMARGNGRSDFVNSLDDLGADLPRSRSVSLVVSWFGNDLRVGHCKIEPRVEQSEVDGDMVWRVSGLSRSAARTPTLLGGRPVYGGTPADEAVIEAIQDMRHRGLEVMFYPFILMDVPSNNQLASPYGGSRQPVNPWRGRITSHLAGAVPPSSAEKARVEGDLARFLGNACRDDFTGSGHDVNYAGRGEWSYRRFILHYAHLCALAGGVDEFLIGSELRGLSTIRSDHSSFPFVDALKVLATDVRVILGPKCKIGYAADWSEYFGYAPRDEEGSMYFHLDPLWGDDNIDFVGIDNYMPISDWRYASRHLDQHHGSIYNLEYLEANICGGEGYDWYYANDEARNAQMRTPIEDGSGEPWIWRYKDIENWWSNRHYDRVNGVRATHATNWMPQSKPIYFTEYGAAAMDLSTNQPNKFFDPKSSESAFAYFSKGESDSFVQGQYVAAFNRYWRKARNNPISSVYNAPMIDMGKAYYWCWDARPWPEFPGRSDLWTDVENYRNGHWLNGRVNAPKLANVVKAICAPLGAENIDVSRLYGNVIGLVFRGDETIRQKLENLMRIYFFHMFYRDGKIHFVSPSQEPGKFIEERDLLADQKGQMITHKFAAATNVPAKIELQYADADSNYKQASIQMRFHDAISEDSELLSFSFSLSEDVARKLTENYLAQIKSGQKRVSFELARLGHRLEIGEIIKIPAHPNQNYIVEKIKLGDAQSVDALALGDVRLLTETGLPQIASPAPAFAPWLEVIDLPFGKENSQQIYAFSDPWVGALRVAYFDPHKGDENALPLIYQPSTMGKLETDLGAAWPDRHDLRPLEVSWSARGFALRKFAEANGFMVAVGSEAGWEMIGFEQFERIGEDRYRLSALCRGMFGSSILDHEAGAKVVALDPNTKAITEEEFGSADHLELFYSALEGEEHFGAFMPLSRPAEALRPLPPAHIKMKNGVLDFVSRQKRDFDEWKDDYGDLLRYRLEFFTQGELVRAELIESTEMALGDLAKASQLMVRIQSIDSDNRMSRWIEKRLI